MREFVDEMPVLGGFWGLVVWYNRGIVRAWRYGDWGITMEWWAIWPSSNWVTLLLGFGVLALGAYVARRSFDMTAREKDVSWRYCNSCRRYHAHILYPDAVPCAEQVRREGMR